MGVLPLQSVVTREADGAVVITLGGAIDLGTAPLLRRKVQHALDEGATSVVLDLGDVRFCDSSGLTALVLAQSSARAADTPLVLRSVPRRVHDLFLLTGIDRVFTIETEAPLVGPTFR